MLRRWNALLPFLVVACFSVAQSCASDAGRGDAAEAPGDTASDLATDAVPEASNGAPDARADATRDTANDAVGDTSDAAPPDAPDAAPSDAALDVAPDDAAGAVDAPVDLPDAADATPDRAEVAVDAPRDGADVATDTPRDITDVASPDAPDAAVDVATVDAPDARPDAADAAIVDASDSALADVRDATAVDPLASVGLCLGQIAEITLSHQLPYLSVPVGAQRGAFLLDYGSNFSSIDLAAFPSPGPTTSGCDRARLGVSCTVADFAFFASPSPVTLVTEDFSRVLGDVRQAGIVGTDFTSLRVTTLSYATARMYAGGGASCDDDTWRAAGLAPLSSEGFFERYLSALAPMSSVDASASSAARVPNIPTVPVRIGATRALAQLDTGFDDALVPFSVNVNEAFFRAIVADDPEALVRDPARDLLLTTCVPGVSESVEAYALVRGHALDFIDDDGAVARRYPNATVFVKRTPASAHACGGIGTWTAPAAQIAASFFIDMGTIVFDPFTSRVWIPTR